MGTFPSEHRSSGDATPGDFPLAAYPSIVIHILTSCKFDPQDLARLEATCSFFNQPANFAPDFSLSLPEVSAFDMCLKRVIFKSMAEEEREALKQRCGGSWKLVLKFLLACEFSTRREKPQAIAGPTHSIVVTSKGEVYTFGDNSSGQLGLGTLKNQTRPQLIRSLQGIRIIHAAAGAGKTMLVSDDGRVYAFGRDNFGARSILGSDDSNLVTEPQLVESLEDIFVVQATICYYFTAVLSREGRVYTLSWETDQKLGHHSNLSDREPRPILGPLENLPVVQIAAGSQYLAALAFQPHGLSVYIVGGPVGGKRAGDSTTDERYPRLVEHLNTLNLQPVCLAAGAWHAAVVGRDGRVCTWGGGQYGCLGYGPGNKFRQSLPKVVQRLRHIKAVYVAAGVFTTFVVSDSGDVYSFGFGGPADASHLVWIDGQFHYQLDKKEPRLVPLRSVVTERIVQISNTNLLLGMQTAGHTFVLAESGNLYAFGSGDMGQLGIELSGQSTTIAYPERVQIDLN